MNEFAQLVLSWMLLLQPEAPWRSTYEETAQLIADVATAEPLDIGPERTAALLTSLAWYESTFNPEAVGDHGKSVCLVQIHGSNLATVGYSRADLLGDRRACLLAGLDMIRRSMAVCRGYPFADKLSHYATGKLCGNAAGLKASRRRTRTAERLLKARETVAVAR